MGILVLVRGISHGVARLTMRPAAGGHSTERWQDKSRSLRRGRAVEDCRTFRHITRGVPPHDSLSIPAIPWHFTTKRTSRPPVP
jgi:hypothetical protein